MFQRIKKDDGSLCLPDTLVSPGVDFDQHATFGASNEPTDVYTQFLYTNVTTPDPMRQFIAG